MSRRRKSLLSKAEIHDNPVFDTHDVVRLLKAAVGREGSQAAFAKRHGVDRAYINMVLSGKRPVTDLIANVLGLRKVYITDEVESD
jgi:hypothetical protein